MILSAKKFAEKVLENGAEVELNEHKSQDCADGETVWTIYAHIDEHGDLIHSYTSAEWTITADMRLTQEESDALMRGDLDDREKAVIIEEMHPQYITVLKMMEVQI